MTKEEMAEEWIKQNCCECCVNKDDCDAGTIDCFAKQAFIAGYEVMKAYNEKLLNGDIEKHNKIVELEKACHKWFMRWREAKKDALYFDSKLQKQIETTYKVVEENNELKEKLNKATEILKVVLNKWEEERWILQSEKEVKMIENVMKEAEQFLKED